MQTPRRILCLALPAAVLLASLAVAYGQDADADKAKKMLKQGLDEFQTLKFSEAKKTLLELSKDLKKHLSAADQKSLDDTLAKVDDAIKKQTAAKEAYNSAEDALKKNDLAKAKEGFATAVASEYLDANTRKDAQAQLDLVGKKIELAAAVPTTKPAAAVSSSADVKPAPTSRNNAEVQIVAKANQLVAAGKAEMEKDPKAAAENFQKALAMVPELNGVKELLEQARQKAAAPPPDTGGIVSRIEQGRILAKQMANLEFDKAYASSQEAMVAPRTASDFSKAEESARIALNVLETNKTLYSAAEYSEKHAKVNDQIRWVGKRRAEWERSEVKQQVDEITRAQGIRMDNEAKQLNQRIALHSEKARMLRKEQRYRQALDELDQILILDRNNRWASEQKEMLEQFVMLLGENGEKDADLAQRSEEQKQMVDLRWSEVPWYDILRYPKNWDQITASPWRRPSGSGASEEQEDSVRKRAENDRKARKKLSETIKKLDFSDIALSEVMQFFQDVYGANINVHWKALADAGIDKATKVDVHLREVTVEKALQVVLKAVSGGVQDIRYAISDGVIEISTKDDLNKETVTRVYDIRDLIVRIPNFAGPRIDMSTMGQNQGNQGTGGGGGGLFGQTANNNADVEQVPTKKELIEQILTTIKETVEPQTWPPQGQGTGIRELGGQLIVTQTASTHDKLLDLISQLREARAIQIAIEARFIEVSNGYLNSIGLNLDLFFNLGSTLGSNITRDAATGAVSGGRVYDPWSGAFVPTQAGTSAWGRDPAGANRWTPIGVHGIQRSYTAAGIEVPAFANMVGKGSDPGGIGNSVTIPALQLGGTFLDDIQVDFLLRATQASSTTRVLTAPRLTLFNGQRAYVTVARESAYIAGYDPLVSDNATASRPIVRVIPEGTVLDVEATVSADRRYVTMTVRPQVNGNVDLTKERMGLILPSLDRQMLETTVSCPDGGTLLLGGQKRTREVEEELGVPLLSKVPIVNRLFTNRGMVRDERTLLILIKPKIIIQREEEENIGQRNFPGP